MPDDYYIAEDFEIEPYINPDDMAEIFPDDEDVISSGEEHVLEDMNRNLEMAEDTLREYPPKYWYPMDNRILFIAKVAKLSLEFQELYADIKPDTIQLYLNAAKYTIKYIIRIQHKICYARYILRAREFEISAGEVHYRRMFMIRHSEEIDSLLSNADNEEMQDINSILLEQSEGCCYFYDRIPRIACSYVIVIAKILTPADWASHEVLACTNPANFYIEYIVEHYDMQN